MVRCIMNQRFFSRIFLVLALVAALSGCSSIKNHHDASCGDVQPTEPIIITDASGSSEVTDINETVYWTPNGTVYHLRKNCPSLNHSTVINNGSRVESGKPRACKLCS